MKEEVPVPVWKRPITFDILAIVFLLWGCYLLWSADARHHYSFYETLRNVVFIAWVGAGLRFWALGLFAAIIPSAAIALLYNPIVPITMHKWQWRPYDRLTLVLSLIAIAFLTLRSAANHTPAKAAK